MTNALQVIWWMEVTCTGYMVSVLHVRNMAGNCVMCINRVLHICDTVDECNKYTVYNLHSELDYVNECIKCIHTLLHTSDRVLHASDRVMTVS